MKNTHDEDRSFSLNDKKLMKRALALARGGYGHVSPNPLVGAVIVKNGRIIGEGLHRRYGEKHAEAEAVESAAESVAGADMYCSLEPCCYTAPGKHQPPCTDLIIHSGISRVFIANLDPNPSVNGRGVQALRDAGIEVRTGLLEKEGEELNSGFFTYQRRGRPFIHLKIAQTLDGRIADRNGYAKWITDEKARRRVHRLRASSDAVLVGIGTLLADDPELTVRLCRGKNPLRIVLDGSLRMPLDAKVASDAEPGNTIVFYTDADSDPKAEELRSQGLRVVRVAPDASGGADLIEVLYRLGGIGVRSILVEGGARVATSFLKQDLVDKVTVFIAPLLLGTGIDAVGDIGVSVLADAGRLQDVTLKTLGDQVVVQGMRARKEEAVNVYRNM